MSEQSFLEAISKCIKDKKVVWGSHYGFTMGKSCQTNLHGLLQWHYWLGEWGKSIANVYHDFGKAFDTLLSNTETDEAQTDRRHQSRLKTGPSASLEMWSTVQGPAGGHPLVTYCSGWQRSRQGLQSPLKIWMLGGTKHIMNKWHKSKWSSWCTRWLHCHREIQIQELSRQTLTHKSKSHHSSYQVVGKYQSGEHCY